MRRPPPSTWFDRRLGELGEVTAAPATNHDRRKGYRYAECDLTSGGAWPSEVAGEG